MKISKKTLSNNSLFSKVSKACVVKASNGVKTIAFKKSSLNLVDTKKLKGGVSATDIMAF